MGAAFGTKDLPASCPLPWCHLPGRPLAPWRSRFVVGATRSVLLKVNTPKNKGCCVHVHGSSELLTNSVHAFTFLPCLPSVSFQLLWLPHPARLQFIQSSKSIKEGIMNKKLLYDMSSKCLFKSSKDIRKGGDQNQRKIRGREIKASEELYGMFSVTLSMPKSGVFQALAPLVPSSLALVLALLGSCQQLLSR